MADILTALGDIARLIAAAAGAIGVLVGLWMCWISFSDARRRAETQGNDPGITEMNGLPPDVIKILPELIKTAAGIAIAVLLLSVSLLIGVMATEDGGNGDSNSGEDEQAQVIGLARSA